MSAVPGVSVVICTHNGARRLRPTLAHLADQVAPVGLAWEVLVVDNASTDETAAAALAAWPPATAAPLRVVSEPRLGVGHARVRGLADASYEAVSFVDDDNWVPPDWVALVWEIMTSRPAVGACGGDAEAAPEHESPAWFARYRDLWAVGPQGARVSDEATHLRGAGLAVRKAAWAQLIAGGFTPTIVGRQGPSATLGEDTEICMALRLSGWRLRYDPRLRLRHFIPAERLTWQYARRVSRGWGMASAPIDHYVTALQSNAGRTPVHRSWTWRVADVVARLAAAWPLALAQPHEGSAAVLRLEMLCGRLRGLLEQRGEWRANTRRLRDAAWRRPRR